MWTKLLAVIAFSLGAIAQTPGQPQAGAVSVQMRNVMYHYPNDVVVHILQLGGALVPVHPGSIPVFDDKNSFRLQIDAAEMAITPESMANVLNSYVFSDKDAPIKDVEVRVEKDRIKIKGKLHKKGDVSFETESSLTLTGDGKIRMHAEKVRALHLPVKGLMDLFGVEVADLIKSGKVRGVTAEKDDLILDPSEAFPPPHIQGKVTGIKLQGGNIVQIFGAPESYKWRNVQARNYMAYRGNRLQFGKLTMTDTDMVLIDPDPSDPFDFYLDHYKEQLMAGYSKTTGDFGLRVYMVDYNKLSRGHATQRPQKASRSSKPK